jgi:hypothetical protein
MKVRHEHAGSHQIQRPDPVPELAMPQPDGSAGNGDPLALGRSGDRWVRWLHTELARRADTPRARLLSLWDVLEEWFATEGFRSSLAARAALALRTDPGDQVAVVIAGHRQAVKALLEDLAGEAGAGDPVALAARLQVLLEGAVVSAVIDGRPGVARTARALTMLALGDDQRGGGGGR